MDSYEDGKLDALNNQVDFIRYSDDPEYKRGVDENMTDDDTTEITLKF